MKKNLIISLLALASISALCGFDSAETVDSIYEKSSNAAVGQESISTDLAFDLVGSVNLIDDKSSSSLGFSADGVLSADIVMAEPGAMQLFGDINLSTFGTSEVIELDAYMVPDGNGGTNIYRFLKDNTSEEGAWTVTEIPSINFSSIVSATPSMNIRDFVDLGIQFQLAPEAAMVDGKECYHLSSTVYSDNLNALINRAFEISYRPVPEEFEQLRPYLSGLIMDMDYYIDTETFLPVNMHIEMSSSDFSAFNDIVAQQIGIENLSVELQVDTMVFDSSFRYGTNPVIEVPEEAYSAVQN